MGYVILLWHSLSIFGDIAWWESVICVFVSGEMVVGTADVECMFIVKSVNGCLRVMSLLSTNW